MRMGKSYPFDNIEQSLREKRCLLGKTTLAFQLFGAKKGSEPSAYCSNIATGSKIPKGMI
jgi:hypothetical protein